MKIIHYLYNAFIIEKGNQKIAIDPGCNMKLFSMYSLIPKNEWNSFTHVLVTHGDPDHYVYADKIARASEVPIICGKDLIKRIDNQNYIIHPRRGGIKHVIPFKNVKSIEVGETIQSNGFSIEGIKTQHGPIYVSFLGIKSRKTPGPEERTGMGSIGFKISLNGTTILNLGDTLFREEWEGLNPDILMLPIGGLGNNTWTLDVMDAIRTVKLLKPEIVIPTHYNVPFLLKKNAAPANQNHFKNEVEKLGVHCKIMQYADELNYN